MHKLSFFFFFLVHSFCVFAQELAFINKAQNKVITVQVGNKLHLAYRGYYNQLEYSANLVLEITDSTITLGNKLFSTDRNRLNHKINQYKTIRIKDIVAFRKRSSGAEIAKNLIQIGTIVGSAIVLTGIYSTSNISPGNALLLSIGTGLSINFGIRGLFPENAKFFIKDGWEIKYLSPYKN
ncbi:MAG: hypothetical protein EAY81_04320 [Bacteroidetes bacterium]|nr:MAG: hypothetical protein EAY81_04320 [Bacteroidota bacterium]